ncbi:MAG: putative quinol monooxygenase [Erythrobacter sp.]
MLLIVGTFRLPPEMLEEAWAVMQEMIEASLEEEGCIAYSYAHDMLEPGLIRVNEAWRDAEALEEHFASEHLEEWRANWDRLGIHDRDLTQFDTKAGKPI